MLELVVGVVFAAAAVLFVLRPILWPVLAGAVRHDSGADEIDPTEDLSPRAVALRALKEIEFDRATGKLSDEDYESLRARYTTDALAALREDGGVVPAASPAVGPPRTAVRPSGATCLACGPRPEADARFCSSCGRRLADAPGFCAGCGGTLEAGARFCARCGSRVAA